MSIVWIAIALGVIEGITEYVPVSSTGHLILAGRWLAFPEDKAASFEIFIQLGAVIAVVWFYRERLLGIAARLPTDPGARAFVCKIFVAFLPAAASPSDAPDAPPALRAATRPRRARGRRTPGSPQRR